jgi:hypothetical protein
VGPGHPAGWRDDDLPTDRIDALVARYLGPTRRAGQGVRPAPRDDEDAVIARLPFDGPERLVLPSPAYDRTPAQVAAYVLSLSSSAPHLFGDRLQAFTADLRALLEERPVYRIDPGATLVRIWRKRSGNNPGHG